MPERDKKLIRAANTARLAFPDDESRQAWLAPLLEARRLIKVLQEYDWPKLAERPQPSMCARLPDAVMR